MFVTFVCFFPLDNQISSNTAMLCALYGPCTNIPYTPVHPKAPALLIVEVFSLFCPRIVFWCRMLVGFRSRVERCRISGFRILVWGVSCGFGLGQLGKPVTMVVVCVRHMVAPARVLTRIVCRKLSYHPVKPYGTAVYTGMHNPTQATLNASSHKKLVAQSFAIHNIKP